METREINENWEFIVLACDGIWDVMSNKEVIDFCRKRIGNGMYPEEICEELMNHCLAPDCQMGGLGGDNMTVVLVCLLNNKPYEELMAKCAVVSSCGGNTTTTTTTITNASNSTISSNGAAEESPATSPADEQQAEKLDLK